jgi:hypothetical protein
MPLTIALTSWKQVHLQVGDMIFLFLLPENKQPNKKGNITYLQVSDSTSPLQPTHVPKVARRCSAFDSASRRQFQRKRLKFQQRTRL